jgi:hypothetical protein
VCVKAWLALLVAKALTPSLVATQKGEAYRGSGQGVGHGSISWACEKYSLPRFRPIAFQALCDRYEISGSNTLANTSVLRH